jgi:pyruvate kinase
MQDLQGPKIRVGRLVGGGPVTLVPGRTLTITTQDILGTDERISSTYAALPADVHPGDRLLLDDGRLRLRVRATADDTVVTEVEVGGPLGEHKGINLPGVAVSAPALTDKDRQDLRFGLEELDVDMVALSFIRTAAEVQEARALVRHLGRDTPLIAKLEKAEAIADLDAIVAVADGVMVARGDLGVELAPEKVPLLQKRIIGRANARGIPVITATQMLESMVQDEAPTRAEASDVANAIWDGSDAVMLSAETAVGHHPLLVLRMMDRIIREAEVDDLRPRLERTHARRPQGYADSVTHAACVLADGVRASAIVGFTRSGRTAQLLSGGRPRVPIYAFSPDARVCRGLALWWGVTPVHHPMAGGLEQNIAVMEAHLLGHCGVQPGHTVVIVGSHPFKKRMHTNFVKYQVLHGPQGVHSV